jgi:ectoine hydroxylase-related dioxygenase (phytanoyl-CoA dioxygenase family)
VIRPDRADPHGRFERGGPAPEGAASWHHRVMDASPTGATGTRAMTADATAADLAAIEDRGYVVIERAAGPDVLDAIRTELAPYLDGGRESYRGRNDFEGFATNRVYGLLAKAPTEATLVTHPRVLAILDAMLRPGYLLSANLAINLLPGETAQDVHFDDTFYPVPRPRAAIGVSAIWAIDDFTVENGATEVIPGSHRWGDGPPPDDAELVPVEMPAGSVAVFAGTLWHRGGANRSDHPRLAITPQYCEPWARQQENMMAVVGPVAAGMAPVLQSLLGYSLYPTTGATAVLGHIDGRHPRKTLASVPPRGA